MAGEDARQTRKNQMSSVGELETLDWGLRNLSVGSSIIISGRPSCASQGMSRTLSRNGQCSRHPFWKLGSLRYSKSYPMARRQRWMRLGMRYKGLWTFWGCFGWHSLAVSHEGQGQFLQSGRLGWWFPCSKKGTRRCAPIIGVSHCSASLGKFPLRCWKGSFDWLSNLTFRNRSRVLHLKNQLFIFSCRWHCFAGLLGRWPSAHTGRVCGWNEVSPASGWT